VLFDYRKGRSADGPKEMLAHYQGILQTYGYSVYGALFAGHADIMLVYCLAHARRKFFEAVKYDKERAEHVLGRMQQLYALEQQMREAE
jgi:transposase